MAKRNSPRRALLEELERRILLSADIESAVLPPQDGLDGASEAITELAQIQDESADSIAINDGRELVFVDAGIPGYERLVEDLRTAGPELRPLDVVVIEADRDGIDQIREALAGYDDLDGVHMVSHGAEGRVQLGDTWLDAQTLEARAAEVGSWGDALAPDGDFLLYGCNLAGDAQGESFVDALAEVTGADVAASADATGDAAAGGDWELEHHDGNVETLALFSADSLTSWSGTLDAGAVAEASDQYVALPLAFEENLGQTDAQVDFMARGSGYTVFLSEGDAVLTLGGEESGYALRLDLVDAEAGAAVSGGDPQSGTSHYLTGGASEDWHTGVEHFGSVTYEGVYEGIDVRYYGSQRQLEYDFIVDAGADASQIRLDFQGADSLRIDSDTGELVVKLSAEGDEIRFKAPVSHQTGADGSREAVESRYVINADGTVGFELGAYDASRELVIDPILDYGTYLGGTGTDSGRAVAVDAAGAIYVTGQTASSDFPTSLGAYDASRAWGYDIFVTKFSADGNLEWSTFVGGDGSDYGNGIAVDGSGAVYVVGRTGSTDFSTTAGAHDTSLEGTQDAVAIKLDASGSSLLYGTYLGGAGNLDVANAVAVDASGNAYLVGTTDSSGLGTVGAFDTAISGTDAFVAQLDGSGALVWSSYLGGSGTEDGMGLALDLSGDVVITGRTDSTNLATSAEAFDSTFAGGTDVYVATLSGDGTSLVYGTYLGTSNTDDAQAVAVDAGGRIFVTGRTNAAASAFPTTTGAYDTSHNGGADVFLSVLDPSQTGASQLAYSTFLGGSSADQGFGLALDADGVAWIAGFTYSSAFPTTADAPDSTLGGSRDAFVAGIDPNGNGASDLVFSTYVGGAADEYGYGVAVDGAGNVIAVGDTASADLGTTAGAQDSALGGSQDAFVVKLTDAQSKPPQLSLPAGAVSYTENDPATIIDATATVSDSDSVDFDGGTLTVDFTANATANDRLAIRDQGFGAGNIQFSGNNVSYQPGGSSVLIGTFSGGTDGSTPLVITLNAAADSTAVQALLRNITYENVSENPSDLTRTVRFVLTDGDGGTSSAETEIINIGAVNDDPTNIGSLPTDLVFLEDIPGKLDLSAIDLSDVDAGSSSLTLTITSDLGHLQTLGWPGLTLGGSQSQLVLTGSLTNLNDFLNDTNSIDYEHATPGMSGDNVDRIAIQVTDNGNTGSGGGGTITLGTVKIDITPANAAPVLTVAGTSLAYTENDGAVAIDTGLAVSDPDSQITGATIRIVAGFAAAEDSLTYIDQLGITGSYNAGTGILTLSGLASAADYQTALRSVTYSNSSEIPSTANRVINFQVTDGTTNTSANRTITITSINDDPTNTGSLPTDVTVTEDSMNSIDLSSFNLQDVDASNQLVAVTLTTATGGEITASSDFDVTVFGSGTGTLTLLGGVSDINNFFSSASRFWYQHGTQHTAGDNADTITVTVNDGGNTGAGGGGTIALGTVNVNITAVNDAPVRIAGTVENLIVAEDSGMTSLGLDSVDYGVGGGSDESSQTLTFEVTTIPDPNAFGRIYLADGTTQVTTGFYSLTDIQGMQFEPALNENGGPSFFSYRVVDSGGGADTLTEFIQLSITAANDAPVAVNDTTSVNEGASVLIDLVGNDTDPDNALDTTSIVITSGPSNGTLVDNNDGTFSYTHDGSETVGDSFSYTIGDASGATSNVASVAITVTPQNDAPTDLVTTTTANGGVSLNEGGGNDVYLVADDGGALLGGLTTVTIETSFSVTTPAGDVTPLLSYADGSNDEELGLFIKSTGELWFTVHSPGAPYQSTSSQYTQLFDGEKHHVGVSWDSSNGAVDFFVDGALVESFTGYQTGQTITGGGELVFGQDQDSELGGFNTTDVFSGSLYDIRIFDDVRTAGEIASSFDLTLPNTEPGMIANWTFGDFSTGGVTTDAVGGNNLTEQHVVGAGFTASVPELTLQVPEGAADGLVIGSLATVDPDIGDTFTYSLLDDDGGRFAINGSNGQVTVANGSLIDFESATSHDITVRVTDSGGLTYDEVFTISVADTNDAPTAAADTLATAEDTALVINVATDLLANDSDVDGDPLSITSFTQPANGTLVDNGNGTFTYTPTANYAGPDSFTYTISDGQGGTDTATVTLTVTPVNDAPTASADTLATAEDTALVIDVATDLLANDSDLDGDPLTITSFTQPANGTLVDNGNGTFTYTPTANYAGADAFTYTISDGQGGTDTATVTLTVTPVNDAPTASADTLATAEDTALVIDVATDLLANDSDLDGDPLTITSFTQPANGTLVDNGNGTFTYTPTANYAGADAFTYTISDGQGGSDTATVTITVGGVNDAPTAAADTLSTAEDTALVIDVATDLLANDSDLDGDPLSITSFTQPANGTLVDNGNGTFTYTPAANYAGADAFTYTISDGQGGTDTATVTLTVTPVNDAPTAAADTLSTAEDTALVIEVAADLLANDSDLDGDPLSITSFTQPANGTLVDNGNGTFTYTPAANYAGPDSFTYTISDGQGGTDTATVTLTVTPVNDAPTAAADTLSTAEDTALVIDVATDLLANDSDLDGDPLSITSFTQPANGTLVDNGSGTLTYTPTANYAGPDSFTYTISDGQGGTDTATVTLTVTPVNDAPTAAADTLSTAEDTALVIDVATDLLANDSDLDGDPLSITSFTQPANGTLVDNGSGTLTYTPTANYAGPDSFTYTISDGQGGTDTATVTLTVTPVNDAPTAAADTLATAEDTALVIDVAADLLANDSDLDGDPLSITSFTQPANGTLVDNGNGTFTYTPTANYAGPDAFTYTISDGQGGSDTATVSLTVTPVNDAPTAAPDTLSTAEDTALVIDVAADLLANDSDLDGDPLSITSFTQPANGTLVDNGNGTFTYTPTANYAGPDAFTYTISDGQGGSDTATVSLTVTPVNDAPTAAPDTLATAEDTALVIDVAADLLANDSDLDGDPLSITSFTQPANGTLVDNGNGTFTYTPTADYAGSDSFTYTISDGQGGSDTATVSLTVTPVGEAPSVSSVTFQLAEDAAIGTSVGLVQATDADGDALTYSIQSGNANGSFSIDAATGWITVADVSAIDFETQPTVDLGVVVSDSSGLEASATVSVDVTDVNEAPSLESASFEVTETASAGTMVGAVTAVDPDVADSLTYSIMAGNSGGAFTVDASTGELRVANAAALDTSINPTFSLTLESRDAMGQVDTAVVTIVVQDSPSSLPSPFAYVDASLDEDPEEEPTEEQEPTIDEPESTVAETEVDSPEAEKTLGAAPHAGASPLGSSSGRQAQLRGLLSTPAEPSLSATDAVGALTSGEAEDTRHRAHDGNDVPEDARRRLLLNERITQMLERIALEMTHDAEQASEAQARIVSTSEGVALVASAGLIGTLLRGGSLAAAALSSLPMWRQIDPVAVLTLSREEREQRELDLERARWDEDADRDGIGWLFDGDDASAVRIHGSEAAEGDETRTVDDA